MRIYYLAIVILFLTGCTEELVLANKVCSQNGTYCEDLKKTGMYNIAYENLTTASDTRSADNTTVYEELLT